MDAPASPRWNREAKAMAWRLIEIAEAEARAEDFSNNEIECLYLAVRDRVRGPYDESNPQFVCYCKVSALLSAVLGSTRQQG